VISSVYGNELSSLDRHGSCTGTVQAILEQRQLVKGICGTARVVHSTILADPNVASSTRSFPATCETPGFANGCTGIATASLTGRL
jgi:hypothetical protein